MHARGADVNRADRRAARRVSAGVLWGACIDGDRVTEVPVEVTQLRRLMRAEGLSFEQASMELVAAGCPICNPKEEAN